MFGVRIRAPWQFPWPHLLRAIVAVYLTNNDDGADCGDA
jgi:hypothetical protein